LFAQLKAVEKGRVRVNEKQKCSGMTPPLSVTGYKEWCVYLRVKPGDNNTCHNVSLIFPRGYKADRLFAQLKAVEKGLVRSWRKAEKVATVAQEAGKVNVVDHVIDVSNEVVTIVETSIPEFNLVKWLRDSANIRTLVVEVGKLEYQNIKNKKDFAFRVCAAAGIDVSPKQRGAIMRGLVEKGLVAKVMVNGTRTVGWKVTETGRNLFGVITAPVQPVKEEPRKSVNRVSLIRQAGITLKSLNTAAERLAEIARDRGMYLAKLKELEAEETELCKIIDNNEVEDLLVQLVEAKKPKAVKV
jgi:hypothetical protein